MIQIIIGLSIALISIEGMLIYGHQEVKQQQKFQQIKGMEITLPGIPEKKGRIHKRRITGN